MNYNELLIQIVFVLIIQLINLKILDLYFYLYLGSSFREKSILMI